MCIEWPLPFEHSSTTARHLPIKLGILEELGFHSLSDVRQEALRDDDEGDVPEDKLLPMLLGTLLPRDDGLLRIDGVETDDCGAIIDDEFEEVVEDEGDKLRLNMDDVNGCVAEFGRTGERGRGGDGEEACCRVPELLS